MHGCLLDDGKNLRVPMPFKLLLINGNIKYEASKNDLGKLEGQERSQNKKCKNNLKVEINGKQKMNEFTVAICYRPSDTVPLPSCTR